MLNDKQKQLLESFIIRKSVKRSLLRIDGYSQEDIDTLVECNIIAPNNPELSYDLLPSEQWRI